MDLARRLHRERAFRIAVQVLGGAASAPAAGRAFADLADVLIEGLSQAALGRGRAGAGRFPGEAAVIALGKMWFARNDGHVRPRTLMTL